MRYAFLFIDMPDISRPPDKEKWAGFLVDVVDARAEQRAEKLSENCWLILIDGNASYLSDLVHAATSHQLGHRILFLDKAPEWVGTWKTMRR